MKTLYRFAPKTAGKVSLPKERGFILQEGISPIDGKPFVVIMTMVSKNRKTGNMAQVFVLRQDVNPVDAIASGDDVTVCGNCPHRRKQIFNEKTKKFQWIRSCYVNVGQAPNMVWKTYKKGGYKYWNMFSHDVYLQNRKVRWGAYGDPAIISAPIVEYINSLAIGHTGYTHQWKEDFAKPFAGVFQASCDGMADYLQATANGWKTFLVVPVGATPSTGKICPATVTNSVAQCLTCSLCDGAKQNIFVEAHGSGAKHVTAV